MPNSLQTRRILYVITDLDVGGVPLHLLRLARAMVERGAIVRVVSLKPAGPVGEMLHDAGVGVASCDACCAFDWHAVAGVSRAIGDFQPDLLHSFLFHANLAARMACLLSGFDRRRLIGEIQTVEIERTWHLTVDRWTHRLSRLTVGNSPSVVAHLHRRAGIPKSRLRVIAGGVDVARIAGATPVARSMLGVGDEPLLIWVGRMDPIKGLDVLLEAVARVRSRRAIRLLLVGDGPQRAQVNADIQRLGLFEAVDLLGRRDDVPALLQAADLFVFPSRTEGLPNALIEAMAAGLPVVATDAPGNRDLISNGLTGRLVPVDDRAALAGAIDRALTDQPTSKRMADTACALVAGDYSLAACTARYRALYEEILEHKSSKPSS